METSISTEEFLKNFLNKSHIVFDTYSQLNNMLIPREILLSSDTYDNVKNDIPKLKKIFSSSSMTALHDKADVCQKWPLLNLVRQILKSINYKMNPIRKSDGYTHDGKKKYKRYFIIEKINSVV